MHLNNETQAERWAYDLRRASSWLARAESTIRADSEAPRRVDEVGDGELPACDGAVEAVAVGLDRVIEAVAEDEAHVAERCTTDCREPNAVEPNVIEEHVAERCTTDYQEPNSVEPNVIAIADAADEANVAGRCKADRQEQPVVEPDVVLIEAGAADEQHVVAPNFVLPRAPGDVSPLSTEHSDIGLESDAEESLASENSTEALCDELHSSAELCAGEPGSASSWAGSPEEEISFCAEPIRSNEEPITLDEEPTICRALIFHDSADEEADEAEGDPSSPKGTAPHVESEVADASGMAIADKEILSAPPSPKNQTAECDLTARAEKILAMDDHTDGSADEDLAIDDPLVAGPTAFDSFADELFDASCLLRSSRERLHGSPATSGDQVRVSSTAWLWGDNLTAWSRSPEEAVLPGFGPAVSSNCVVFSMSADDSVETLPAIDPCIAVDAGKGITDCTDSSDLEDWVESQMQRSSELLALFKEEMHFMEKVADELAERRNLAECEATCIDALEEEEATQQKGLCMLESMVSTLSARCRHVQTGDSPQYFPLGEEDTGAGTSSSSSSLYRPIPKSTKPRRLPDLQHENVLRTSKVKEDIRRIVQGAEETWEAQRKAFQEQAIAAARNNLETNNLHKRNARKLPKEHARQPLRLQRRDNPREQQSLLRQKRILAQQHIDRELQRTHFQTQTQLEKVEICPEVYSQPEDLCENAEDNCSMTKVEGHDKNYRGEPFAKEPLRQEIVGRFGRRYLVDAQSPCQSPRQSADQEKQQAANECGNKERAKASDGHLLPGVASLPEESVFAHDAEPAPEPNCCSPGNYAAESEEQQAQHSPLESPRLMEREKRSLARRMMSYLAAEHGQQQKAGEGCSPRGCAKSK
eukprot:TRINITY_DN15866_c0_g1_i1.p1 TRINITY_DN15866_c0_g1~~TRINITY_DN15866_c0_g1_i1.p1  ORF type:complete len:1026 (-),score=182.55 TRINITY_DN15866_c0_g1_i1:114-2735(-)